MWGKTFCSPVRILQQFSLSMFSSTIASTSDLSSECSILFHNFLYFYFFFFKWESCMIFIFKVCSFFGKVPHAAFEMRDKVPVLIAFFLSAPIINHVFFSLVTEIWQFLKRSSLCVTSSSFEWFTMESLKSSLALCFQFSYDFKMEMFVLIAWLRAFMYIL